MNGSFGGNPEISVNIASGENSDIELESSSKNIRKRYRGTDRPDDDSDDLESQEESSLIRPVIILYNNQKLRHYFQKKNFYNKSIVSASDSGTKRKQSIQVRRGPDLF